MSEYDRSTQDIGNILLLEHINLTVPDQELAALFYVSGLGLTRDPYIDFGTRNMWVNAGEQQFHLPRGNPQRLRGHIGLIVPSRDELHERLTRLATPLRGTAFAWSDAIDHTQVSCPWGNRFHVHDQATDGAMGLGIAHVVLHVSPGTTAGIARFYRAVFGCAADAGEGRAHVHIGRNQSLRFVECDTPLPDYDGHHVAIYVANFSGPHRALSQHGLISEESDAHQYRFQTLFDPEDGRFLTELEHEVRSLHHPMYQRPLINRNAANNFFTYRKGREQYIPS